MNTHSQYLWKQFKDSVYKSQENDQFSKTTTVRWGKNCEYAASWFERSV